MFATGEAITGLIPVAGGLKFVKEGAVLKNAGKKDLKIHFGDKIGGFTMFEQTYTPCTMFSMEFQMYKYFTVILNCDRGHLDVQLLPETRESA